MKQQDSLHRYLKLAHWARKRYTTPEGNLTISVGGRPSAFARIEQAAWDRHLRTVGAKA